MKFMMTAAKRLIVSARTMRAPGTIVLDFGMIPLLDASLDDKCVGRECHGETSFTLPQRERRRARRAGRWRSEASKASMRARKRQAWLMAELGLDS